MNQEALDTARQAMTAGEYGAAVQTYQRLVESGEGLSILIADLETAVRHHFDPVGSCRAYDETAQLPAALWGTLQDDDVVMLDMLGSVSPLVRPAGALSDAEVVDLLAFLEALTDPAVYALDGVVPTAVPSGLPVSDG